MAKEQRTYNVKEYAEKAKQALKKLAAEQVAGQVTSGSKMNVLESVKEDIQNLLDQGYTTQQIADALKNNDVFGILPKSITELIKGKKRVVKHAAKPAEKAQGGKPAKAVSEQDNKKGNKQANKPASELGTSAAGTFAIKPDSEDL